jgi:hypothetical protein
MGEDGRNTEDLMRLLNEGALSDVVHAEDLLPTFPNQLARLCAERETARERVIQRAQIERSYGHQLFNGTRRPSRDKVIQLAFGFGLDLKQTQELLKIAGQSPLVPQVKRDAAILYCVLHQLPLDEVQKLLENFMMHALGN